MSRNAELCYLECTQECEPEYDFDPIKDGTLRAPLPKNIGV